MCGKGDEGKRSEVTDSATATAAAAAAGAAATVIASNAAAAGASLYSCHYKRYCSATVIATTSIAATVSNNFRRGRTLVRRSSTILVHV